MTERKEFYEMVVGALRDDEFERIFGEKPVDIMDFDYNFDKVHWNQNLEYAYNDFIAGEEYEDDYDESYADISNMYCDDTGYCSSSCPNFFKCH